MRLRPLFCAAFLWLVATPASASPFLIDVLSTNYSVTLRDRTMTGGVIVETFDTTTGTSPVSDSYLLNTSIGLQGGTASADMFQISTWTSQGKFKGLEGDLDHMWAYANTALTFAPVVTGTASIDVSFLLGGMFLFSESMVRLVDLTTSTNVWSLGWAYKDDPTMRDLSDAPNTMTSLLDSSHLYQLTLFGRTDARDDSQSLTASVSGLQAVPEPSTLLLVGLGVGATAIKRARGRREAARV